MRLTSPTAFSTAAMLLIGLVGTLCLASSAEAGEVHFDSQSPAGKEYALPLPQARGEALGTDAPADPPLFGVGIGDPKSGGEERAAGTSGDKAAATPGGESGREGKKHKTRGGAQAKGSDEAPAAGGKGNRPPAAPIVISPASYDTSGGIALIVGLTLIAIIAGLALRFSPARRAPGLH
jgi:hypothetical protein